MIGLPPEGAWPGVPSATPALTPLSTWELLISELVHFSGLCVTP